MPADSQPDGVASPDTKRGPKRSRNRVQER